MFALFTDYGLDGPYTGQLHACLAADAPGVPVIDLFHDVPAFDIRAAAYLLPAYTSRLPPGTVCLCVVDPGVGGPREALMARAFERWYVGPDNGLFAILARRDPRAAGYRLRWRPSSLSASFHGRDLFAPCAARLMRGERPDSEPAALTSPEAEWPDDWPHILYIDRFGNAITGVRASTVDREAELAVSDRRLRHARVFSEVAPGEAFWYENANGLVEIAVNRGRADRQLGLSLGQALAWHDGAGRPSTGAGRHA